MSAVRSRDESQGGENRTVQSNNQPIAPIRQVFPSFKTYFLPVSMIFNYLSAVPILLPYPVSLPAVPVFPMWQPAVNRYQVVIENIYRTLLCLNNFMYKVKQLKSQNRVCPESLALFCRPDVELRTICLAKFDGIVVKWLSCIDFSKEFHIFQVINVYPTGKLLIGGHADSGDLIMIKTIKSVSPQHVLKLSIPKEYTMQKMAMEDNPRIVPVVSWCQYRLHHFIVMKLMVPTTNLLLLIKDTGALPEHSATLIMKQLFEIVKKIHRNGVVHRNLKVDNILVNPITLHTYVMGFDYATKFENSGYSEMAGTFYPPEWIKHGRYTAEKIDVWYLGLLMYYILYARYPFDMTRPDRDDWILTFGNRMSRSDKAKHLILCLLQVNDKIRFNLDQASAHCWFNHIMPH